MSDDKAGSLYRILKKSMIRLVKADRIIPSVKYPVQHLNSASTSYVAGFSTLGETLPPSYVARAGTLPNTLTSSYVSPKVAPLMTAGSFHIPPLEPSVSIPLALGLLFGTTVQAEVGEFTDSDLDQFGESDTSSEKRGVIYVRVSSNEQAESGYSLETQVEDLRKIAEENGITLIASPIRDEGESGTNFDREGIKEVFRLASAGEITHLLVDDVDRLGRTTPETLYFIHLLQTECDVEIISSAGRIDTTQIRGLIETTMRTLMSDVAVKGRARKATNTRIHRFVQQRQWSTWFHTIPLGYTEREDGWIETDTEEIEVAEDLFDHFLKSESYSGTKRYLNEEYQDRLESRLTRSQIKQLLQKPVYKGKPTIPIGSVRKEETEKTVDDSGLAIVDEDTFDSVQRIIDHIAKRNSTGNEAPDVSNLIDEFGLFPVVESSPVVEVVCPSCNSVMVKNGQRDLSNEEKRQNYKCNSCGKQRRYPYQREYKKLQQSNAE